MIHFAQDWDGRLRIGNPKPYPQGYLETRSPKMSLYRLKTSKINGNVNWHRVIRVPTVLPIYLLTTNERVNIGRLAGRRADAFANIDLNTC